MTGFGMNSEFVSDGGRDFDSVCWANLSGLFQWMILRNIPKFNYIFQGEDDCEITPHGKVTVPQL